MINVLVACECSQVYLSEFMKYPLFNPVSVDLLPTNGKFADRHIIGDVRDFLFSVNSFSQSGIPVSVPSFDLIVAFPPCTYFTNAGSRWFNVDRYGDLALERYRKRSLAAELVNDIWNSNANVFIENPRGYMSHILGKPFFEGHPFWFGEPYRKRTCFWGKGKGFIANLRPHLPCDDPGLSADTYIGSDGYLKKRSFVLDNVNSSIRSRSFEKMASCVVAALVCNFIN